MLTLKNAFALCPRLVRLNSRFLAERLRTLSAALVVVLSAIPSDAASVKLQWNPSPDPATAGYIIWHGRASGNYTSSLDVGLVDRFEVSGLADYTFYCFVVEAYNVSGLVSPPTNET